MENDGDFLLRPVGVVESVLQDRERAPNQGDEGAPDAWIQIDGRFAEGLNGLVVGQRLIVLTWFHKSRRDVLRLHPQWNKANPLTGVFNTRSPDRPNPIGLHPVTLYAIDGTRLKVGPLEAIDGTPIVDIKPVI